MRRRANNTQAADTPGVETCGKWIVMSGNNPDPPGHDMLSPQINVGVLYQRIYRSLNINH